MSAWLKYYDDEFKLFKKWERVKLTPEQTTFIIRKLVRYCKLTSTKIDIYDGGREGWSAAYSATWFSQNRLKLNVNRLTLLLVAHEVAHLLVDSLRSQGKEPPGRDHGPAHRRCVQRLFKYIETKDWITSDKINRYIASKEAA